MLKLNLDSIGSNFELITDFPLKNNVLKLFNKYGLQQENNLNIYSFAGQPNSAFILQAMVNKRKDEFSVSNEAQKLLNKKIKMVVQPKIFLYDETHVGIECPTILYYRHIMEKLGAYERNYGLYTVPFSRAFEVVRMLNSLNYFLPNFEVDSDLKNTLLTPLESFDGTLSSLYNGDICDLYTVKNAWKATPENFEKAGYHSPVDFIVNRPLRYIDKTKITPINDWLVKDDVVFLGKIISKEIINFQHALFVIQVGTQKVQTMFYRRQWMIDKYKIGEEVLVIGKYGGIKRNGPEVGGSSMDSMIEANSLPIVPIYSQSQKNNINTKIILNAVYELFTRLDDVTKDIAGYIKIDNDELKMNLQQAIYNLHFPKDIEDYKKALDVLAFYELVYMQLLIIHRKATEEKKKGLPKPFVVGGLADQAEQSLPFNLTDAQKEALAETKKQLGTDAAEQALISGDVGSGKTLVAQLTCLQAVDNGYQAVLAGPTEVLAAQLFYTFEQLLAGIPQESRPTIVYLSGALKAAERRAVLKSIEFGEVDIIVGTHSVLNKKVPYKNLGVVLIDEQQKFGTDQRNSLLDIRDDGYMPDVISQTATPIPRSTAQVFYGDINLIQIKTKPKGRKPIITQWLHDDPRDLIKRPKAPLWKEVIQEAELGHKTFIVVPMVYENPKMNAASVQETVKQLNKILPNIEIEYVHGQMKKKEQTEHIENFRNGTANVLVASTVIEVGVDIPLATRMIVLSADRLGASSLHQIRGRVGRNDLQSYCYLVSNNEKEANTARLESLVNSNDGFEIATVDLHTRGEGDLFGAKQSGETNLQFANLVDHSKLINQAKSLAEIIYKTPRKVEALNDANAVLRTKEE